MSSSEDFSGEDIHLSVRDEVAALTALLRWYEAVGVDEAVDVLPRDYFAEFASHSADVAPPRAEAPRLSPARPQDVAPERPRPPVATHLSPDEASRQASQMAAAAPSLAALRAALEQFEGCSLRKSAQRLVFGEGAPHPRVMVIGETPDRDDDNSGKPFSGLRGILLERMLRAIGLTAEMTYLMQIVPWFPPGNAMPAKHHIDACLPFARRHISLVSPDSLICLGWVAEKLGLEKSTPAENGMTRHVLDGREINVLILPELGEIMRSPVRKRRSWDGLRAFQRMLS